MGSDMCDPSLYSLYCGLFTWSYLTIHWGLSEHWHWSVYFVLYHNISMENLQDFRWFGLCDSRCCVPVYYVCSIPYLALIHTIFNSRKFSACFNCPDNGESYCLLRFEVCFGQIHLNLGPRLRPTTFRRQFNKQKKLREFW